MPGCLWNLEQVVSYLEQLRGVDEDTGAPLRPRPRVAIFPDAGFGSNVEVCRYILDLVGFLRRHGYAVRVALWAVLNGAAAVTHPRVGGHCGHLFKVFPGQEEEDNPVEDIDDLLKTMPAVREFIALAQGVQGGLPPAAEAAPRTMLDLHEAIHRLRGGGEGAAARLRETSACLAKKSVGCHVADVLRLPGRGSLRFVHPADFVAMLKDRFTVDPGCADCRRAPGGAPSQHCVKHGFCTVQNAMKKKGQQENLVAAASRNRVAPVAHEPHGFGGGGGGSGGDGGGDGGGYGGSSYYDSDDSSEGEDEHEYANEYVDVPSASAAAAEEDEPDDAEGANIARAIAASVEEEKAAAERRLALERAAEQELALVLNVSIVSALDEEDRRAGGAAGGDDDGGFDEHAWRGENSSGDEDGAAAAAAAAALDVPAANTPEDLNLRRALAASTRDRRTREVQALTAAADASLAAAARAEACAVLAHPPPPPPLCVDSSAIVSAPGGTTPTAGTVAELDAAAAEAEGE